MIKGLKCVVRESRRIDEEGTVLRNVFREGRLILNSVIAQSYLTAECWRDYGSTRLEEMKPITTPLKEVAVKIDETRVNKPEIIVGTATATVFGLSFLGSRRRIIVDTITAAVLSSSAVYGSLWWQARTTTTSQEDAPSTLTASLDDEKQPQATKKEN
mmetsp:Transcript_20783/g.25080  ORF Transcript_20783/g.25080 Transcript_20783/m.25080 type:complete len:158 (+) Transcript_20783:1-474(+)